jgi:hypothetical protein
MASKSNSITLVNYLIAVYVYFNISEINCESIQRVNKSEVAITVYQCAGYNFIRKGAIYSEKIELFFNFFHLDALSIGYHENPSSETCHHSPHSTR